ncbi:Vascular endothelial growth factor receptor 1 [Orchesella cincta]|uniref:Vascular endothelial growth factor receptor 1 n=1 Tax=Orchesella cincta TaxID=48709 RepID=A0A1D2MP98_ORCCI|nr:Vascular endothelial growth factor receptor 1 [Orchesella cincta]
MSSSASCATLHCETIGQFLYTYDMSYPKLNQPWIYYFFNGTGDCTGLPVIKDNVTFSTVNETFTLYDRRNWAIGYCTYIMEHCDANCEPTTTMTLKTALLLQSKTPKSGFATLEIIVLSVTSSLAVIMLVVVLVLAFLLWRKKRKILAIRSRAPKRNQQGVPQVDPIEENDYVNDITGLHTICRSFKTEGYELTRDVIDIGSMRDSTTSIVGVGESSITFKGKLLMEIRRTIAVKTIKSGQATTRSIKKILRECQVMIQLGKHHGIVEFIGVCTENIRKGEVFTVFEYCERGSLKSFLNHNRTNFVDLVKSGNLSIVENMQKTSNSHNIQNAGAGTAFNTLQLVRWCIEISDCLEFLALRKVVHVTLSARNVLLDANLATKLADFSLVKIPGSINSTQTTIVATNRDLIVPWRWFAIESLLDDVFSPKSDVWTYGIFMWELFTLGSTPYPEYSYGSEFTMCIKHGYRLPKPNFSTVECYELMLICWYDDPDKRPTFTKLKRRLTSIISCSASTSC